MILTSYKWVPAAFAASYNHPARWTKRSHVIRTKKTTTSAKLERPEKVETKNNFFRAHMIQNTAAAGLDGRR